MGLSLDKVGKEVLGHASKVVLTKDTTTIVGDGSTQEAVNKRVAQIRNLIEVLILLAFHSQQNVWRFYFFPSSSSLLLLNARYKMQAAEQDYEKEKLNERIAKLSGGVAVIQVIFLSLTKHRHKIV